MEYIVDIQGFRRSSNIFILKELAIISLTGEEGLYPTYCLFEAPCKFSRLLREEKPVNKWLEYRFHGIPWESGLIPYNKYIQVVQGSLKDATKIYVKGLEKKRWLEELLPEKYIVNLEDIKCPPSRMLKKNGAINCGYHSLHDQGVCAIKNANAYKIWFIERYSQTSNIEDEVDRLAINLREKLKITDD